MRRYHSLGVAIALAGLVYSGSNAWAQSWCAVQTSVHNHASIMLKHKKLARCMSGAAGCKCVSCYDFTGAVSTVCAALVAPIPK
jgi:hypothetical protein